MNKTDFSISEKTQTDDRAQRSDTYVQKLLEMYEKVSCNAGEPAIRREIIEKIGEALIWDVRSVPEREGRLVWMEPVLDLLSDVAVQQRDESGGTTAPAIAAVDQLGLLGRTDKIVQSLSQDEKWAYATCIRDGLAAAAVLGANETVQRHARLELREVTQAALAFVSEDQRHAYCLPLIDTHVKMVDNIFNMNGKRESWIDPQKIIQDMLVEPHIKDNLTGPDYTHYVSTGVKAVLTMRDRAPARRKGEWNDLVTGVMASPEILAVVDETILKQTGYLDLTGHQGESLQLQLGVMEAFLQDKDEATIDRYTDHMGAQILLRDKNFGRMSRTLTDVTDRQSVQNLAHLQDDYDLLVATWIKYVPELT